MDIEQELTVAVEMLVAGLISWEEFVAECTRVKDDMTHQDAIDYLTRKS